MSDKFNTLKARVMRRLARTSFPFFERYLDLHVTPNDYYSPIPSVKDLPADIYQRGFSMKGVDMNEAAQLVPLDDVFWKYTGEYRPQENGGLSLVDAFVLYALIRERKPKKIVEIGGGDSTFISMKAVEANRGEGHACQFVCIEPYPREFLVNATWPDYRLIAKVVQDVPLELFDDADLVFIDSSHVAKIGSDVNHEILEIMPRLKVGCLVHWHDILLPTNYWPDWIGSGTQFWNESYFVHAFLMFNSSFKVRWAARYMKLQHEARLQTCFPYLDPEQRLTSLWVERTI